MGLQKGIKWRQLCNQHVYKLSHSSTELKSTVKMSGSLKTSVFVEELYQVDRKNVFFTHFRESTVFKFIYKKSKSYIIYESYFYVFDSFIYLLCSVIYFTVLLLLFPITQNNNNWIACLFRQKKYYFLNSSKNFHFVHCNCINEFIYRMKS